MIGVMPNRLRPLRCKQRTLPRGHRRHRMALVFAARKDLPAARVVVEPRTLTELIAAGMASWFNERWTWLRPRLIPVAVAIAGMVATLGAANQLSKPPTEPARIAAPAPPVHDFSRIHVVLQQ